MAVLAHPDDESLGVGGTLAKYASEGVDVFLLTATRGDSGRFRGHRLRRSSASRAGGAGQHPRGRATRRCLGAGCARGFTPRLPRSAARPCKPARGCVGHCLHLRRVRPDVVVTFGPDGAYGHPDHIAISQFTTAAIVRRPIPRLPCDGGERVATCGLEALLPGMAGIDVDSLPGRVQEDSLHGRRRRAAGNAMARVGDHHRHRHAELVVHRVAGDLVPSSRK